MVDLLRDPLWQFAGVILAIVAIGISVAVYFAQRQRKDLSYDVLWSTRLLNVSEKSLGPIQVLYDGAPVTDPQLIVMRVANTGNVPITAEDFERPVSFQFGDGCAVLSATVGSTEPEHLGLSVVARDACVILEPVLLNQADSATLTVLVSGKARFPTADGRIRGVHSIHPVLERRWVDWSLMIGGCVWFAGMAAYSLTHGDPWQPPRLEDIPAMLPALASAGLFLMGFIRLSNRGVRRKQSRTIFSA